MSESKQNVGIIVHVFVLTNTSFKTIREALKPFECIREGVKGVRSHFGCIFVSYFFLFQVHFLPLIDVFIINLILIHDSYFI